MQQCTKNNGLNPMTFALATRIGACHFCNFFPATTAYPTPENSLLIDREFFGAGEKIPGGGGGEGGVKLISPFQPSYDLTKLQQKFSE